jgi:hypothetical protein
LLITISPYSEQIVRKSMHSKRTERGIIVSATQQFMLS